MILWTLRQILPVYYKVLGNHRVKYTYDPVNSYNYRTKNFDANIYFYLFNFKIYFFYKLNQ